MASNYKSIYVKDLIPLIAGVAVKAMRTPCLEGRKLDGTQMTLTEIAAYNSLVAWHNDGVREMANMLADELRGDDDD